VAGGWRRLLEKLLVLNIIRVINSRKMRWVGHVACMGDMITVFTIVGKPEGKRETMWKT
jgi:hypothetical protein